MRYQGGKHLISPKIASEIKFYRKSGQEYLEPFVGGLSILWKVQGERVASDSNRALITLYQAIQMGWEPPHFISVEEWKDLKARRNPHDPMTALAGCAASYGGIWFSKYIKEPISYTQSRRHLLRKISACKDVIFHWRDYQSYSPKNKIIYCDPPYRNSARYGAVDAFDHDIFWDVAREWSRHNTVLISETSAPDDFEPICSFTTHVYNKKTMRTEHLWKLRTGQENGQTNAG